MIQITSKELVYQALQGKKHHHIPSGPLAVQFCAKVAGVSIYDYTYSAEIMANSIIHYYEKYKPDAVWVSNDTWVVAEAMGAPVAFPDENQPLGGTGYPLIASGEDLKKIPPADIYHQGRCSIILEAIRLVKKTIGDEVFIVGCFDQLPFSLACALMGMNQAMLCVVTERSFLEDLMARCSEYCLQYAEAMAETGVDMLSTGDSPAGLIGKELYQQVALPAEREIFTRLKESTDAYLSLHICGEVTHILDDMSGAGAHVLEIDSLVDIEAACRLVNPEITLWGNLNPVDLLEQGDVDMVKYEIQKIKDILQRYDRTRFVLSSGCALSMGTNEENLKILCQSIDSSGA